MYEDDQKAKDWLFRVFTSSAARQITWKSCFRGKINHLEKLFPRQDKSPGKAVRHISTSYVGSQID